MKPEFDDICPENNGLPHAIAYVKPEKKSMFEGHREDKDLICTKCGVILERYRWNGRYLEIKKEV